MAHRVTVEAFRAAGDPSRYPEQLSDGLAPWAPRKLYYFAFTRSMAREFREAMRESGQESDIGEVDMEELAVPDEDISAVIDISRYADRKEQAARQHRTQFQGDDPFSWLPASLRERYFAKEYLVRLEPPFDKGRESIEDDLFAGI